MPRKNRDSLNEYQRERYQREKETMRGYRYKTTYGITLEEYDELFEVQAGKCAICRRPQGSRRLCVDHDHDTGEVRGLLCNDCNFLIGNAREDILILRAAIDYLEDVDGSSKRAKKIRSGDAS